MYHRQEDISKKLKGVRVERKNTMEKASDIISGRMVDLEKMLVFLNTNIDRMNRDGLYNLMGEYVHLVMPENSETPFQHFMERHYKFVKDILNDPNPEGEDQMKKFMSSIQAHLRYKVNNFMLAMVSDQTFQLSECKGIQRYVYAPSSGKIILEFEPEIEKDGASLNLNYELNLIENRFMEIVRDLSLSIKSGRFKKCKKCGNFFYQATKREKIYCSRNCAKAKAQQKYIKGKKRLQY